jgi:hypothetical protein
MSRPKVLGWLIAGTFVLGLAAHLIPLVLGRG